MSKLLKLYDEQDATAVALPEYREPEVRPWKKGDYTTHPQRLSYVSSTAPLHLSSSY